ncbi:dihydroorotate dehydrogenase [bacterium]
MEQKSRLEISLKSLRLKNPVIAASGTFGYGDEVQDLINVSKFGAVTTKTITYEPRLGNEPPRLLETCGGLLNSIGLQNVGLEAFINDVLPKWDGIENTCLIVSVGGDTVEEYIRVCKILDKFKRIDAFELNISCPNVKKGCLAIGSNKKALKKLLKGVKKYAGKPVIVKLSPNFRDIKETALYSQKFGADILSLVNTFIGMSIDVDKGYYYFKNKIAGLSGPAIKPLALKIVHDVCSTVNIPVIGMGGIMNTKHSLEFLMAGAGAVSIGTANFINPKTIDHITNGLEEYCIKNNIENISMVKIIK